MSASPIADRRVVLTMPEYGRCYAGCRGRRGVWVRDVTGLYVVENGAPRWEGRVTRGPWRRVIGKPTSSSHTCFVEGCPGCAPERFPDSTDEQLVLDIEAVPA